MAAVNDRFLFVCCALLAFTSVALGDGTYQRTRDGKTLVWNNHPQPGDEATWSGDRDREGYAGGFGTLTWYSVDSQSGFAEPALYARYWGNMAQGKLDGSVNVHSRRKTHHAIFTDGVRMTRWAPGPAPMRASAQYHAAIAKKQAVSKLEAPAEGPTSPRHESVRMPERTGEPVDQSSENRGERLEVAGSPMQISPSTDQNSSIPDWPKIDIDDSLRILVWPPRSLRSR